MGASQEMKTRNREERKTLKLAKIFRQERDVYNLKRLIGIVKNGTYKSQIKQK